MWFDVVARSDVAARLDVAAKSQAAASGQSTNGTVASWVGASTGAVT
jgi:hypothetical protein